MEKIQSNQLEAWSQAYQNNPERRLAALALSKCALGDVAYVSAGGYAMRHKFSVDIPTMAATNQKSSGRCWLFAAANVLRERIAKEKNLAQFEISQSHLAFWDKFERCNYFLESILETAHLPVDDRTVFHVLRTGVNDGGQWDMFVNIVKKYGVMPKDVYDETFQSSNTGGMSGVLNRNLKVCAVKLRAMAAEGASAEALQEEKNAMLQKIYGFLCSCYGEPPKTFDFECVDKDGVYSIEKDMTAETFRDKYVGNLLDEIVSIIHAPTADKPWHKTFTIRLLGNVVGGKDICHLNLTLEEFKDAVIKQLQAGKIVWFGSDVGHYGERTGGIWDDGCYDFERVTGLELGMSKTDALDYGLAAMNHAMCITGVNLDDGKPNRWKIENSWGDANGNKGYYVCSDSWFDAYVFQAAVEKEYLGELAAYVEQAPIVLEPWDPMGTLAE